MRDMYGIPPIDDPEIKYAQKCDYIYTQEPIKRKRKSLATKINERIFNSYRKGPLESLPKEIIEWKLPSPKYTNINR